MGRFSTKKSVWYFWQQNIDLIFVRVAKYWFNTKISTQFLCELQTIGSIFDTKCRADTSNSLVNQILWLQGAYRLEIISICSERVCLYKFCSEDSTDFVDCWLVSNQLLRCKNRALISVKCMPKGACVYCCGSCCIDASQRLVWHQSTIDRICRFLRTKFV